MDLLERQTQLEELTRYLHEAGREGAGLRSSAAKPGPEKARSSSILRNERGVQRACCGAIATPCKPHACSDRSMRLLPDCRSYLAAPAS
jgi:hypothetical protein